LLGECKIRSIICNKKDFLSGFIYILFGLGTLILARNYRMGTASRMGPGYFPVCLGVALTIIGIFLAIRALLKGGEEIRNWGIQPLFLITAAIFAFSFLIESFGFLLATLALIMISSLAAHRFQLYKVAFLYLFLAVLGYAIFVFGLNLPFKVWP
jgi:hypothetical protein